MRTHRAVRSAFCPLTYAVHPIPRRKLRPSTPTRDGPIDSSGVVNEALDYHKNLPPGPARANTGSSASLTHLRYKRPRRREIKVCEQSAGRTVDGDDGSSPTVDTAAFLLPDPVTDYTRWWAPFAEGGLFLWVVYREVKK
ncbi:hypothetical protein EVAR_37388_1 [Eumeta japonica]|uniref:Uncharacterized protein n=1 Tax=Eumeta variegata TaxID=151549 RepID=A0A4C1ZRC1_EUMVA|nr:hypothetical protein EVAR_37388_1 [Eumeta japonica]